MNTNYDNKKTLAEKPTSVFNKNNYTILIEVFCRNFTILHTNILNKEQTLGVYQAARWRRKDC